MVINRHTSRKLRFLAKAWIAFPFLYLAVCFGLFKINAADLLKIVLSPWYWFVSFIAIVSGLGVLQIRWYAWYVFLLSSVTAIYQTAVAMTYYSHAEHKLPIFAGYVLAQLLLVYLVAREVRVPYYFPKIRWWESDPRYKLSIPAKVERQSEHSHGEIMDISKTGCFIKTREFFTPDESIGLEFSLFDHPIWCDGVVVWKTESTVTHPRGIGVKFQNLDKETVSALKSATRKLRKLTQEYNQQTREKNWKEYLAREELYQSKSKTKK